MANLKALNFDNSYVRLPEHFYQEVEPTPLTSPFLIAFNPDVAALLDLDPCSVNPNEITPYLGGEKLIPGSEPIAMKYTGHQFGVYNPELGDGRGILLGEVINKHKQRWDLHLKGAGKTAFSRFGDGRAVLRSSIREYLVSEAMHGLRIPTTRALALCGSEERAMREGMMEPCATLLRVTQCHIRFGHFEHFYYTRQFDDLKRLADYCLVRYFPEAFTATNPYLAMFNEVIKLTTAMVAKWQAYGFVHAVLNTDNMSIIGESFDYGPYSFMDRFKWGTVSNQNDHQGRYAFGRQPEIINWNLSALGQTLLPLVEQEDIVKALDRFPELYKEHELAAFKERLGLEADDSGDEALVAQLQELFSRHQVDMNRFFRTLSDYDGSSDIQTELASIVTTHKEFSDWLALYDKRLNLEVRTHQARIEQMKSVNPVFILRNYMAQEAIQAAHDGDFSLIHELAQLLKSPFEEQSKFARFADNPPDWAGSICLTCSS